jgi:hypothetical protein
VVKVTVKQPRPSVPLFNVKEKKKRGSTGGAKEGEVSV